MIDWIVDDKLKEPPSNKRLALQADYVELLAIVNIDKSYRISSYADQVSEDEAFSIDDVVQNEQIPSTWEDMHNADEQVTAKTEINGDFDVVFGQRANIWAKYWPFTWHKQDQELKFNASHPNAQIYVSLLLASSLRMIQNTKRNCFTTFLEETGYYVLQKIFHNWTVKGCGANQHIGSHYAETTPLEKFTALSNDINCLVNETYQPPPAGDGQVDLVAYYSWNDDLRGQLPTVFAQCCCSPDSREIGDKIAETDYMSVANKLRLHSPNLNFYFSPQDLEDVRRKSKWSVERINGATIIDRGRLLKMLTADCFINSVALKVDEFTALSVNFDAA